MKINCITKIKLFENKFVQEHSKKDNIYLQMYKQNLGKKVLMKNMPVEKMPGGKTPHGTKSLLFFFLVT